MRAIDVCTGASHSCALDEAGDVQCWGDNEGHQVGLFDDIQTSTPTRVVGVPKSRALRCAAASSCAVTSSDEAWCWGKDAAFREPRGAPLRIPFAFAVRDFAFTSTGGCAVGTDRRVRCFSRYASAFEATDVPGIEGATGFVARAAESSRICVQRSAKPVICFEVESVVAPKAERDAPPRPEPPTGPLVFRDVREEPSLPGPGASLPSSTTGTHVCTVRADGAVGCSGRATSGQLGDGVPYVHGPARVPELDDAVSLSVGKGGACAVRRTGELVCWGRHAHADSPSPMRVVPAPFRSDEVAVGSSLLDAARICARDADTKGWRCLFGSEWLVVPKRFVGRPKPALLDAQGGTWNLELHGNPTRTFFFSQVGLSVAALGHDGYCAVDRKGALACGHCGACATPRDALTTIVADEPFVLVGSLTYDEVRETSVCALTTSGKTLCYEIAKAPYGRAEPKALAVSGWPSGAVDISSSGGRYEPNLTCVRTEAGEVHCFGDARYLRHGGAPAVGSLAARRIEGLPPVVGVGTGGSFACAREAAGSIWCWGSNRDGGAPDGAPLERPDGVVVELR